MDKPNPKDYPPQSPHDLEWEALIKITMLTLNKWEQLNNKEEKQKPPMDNKQEFKWNDELVQKFLNDKEHPAYDWSKEISQFKNDKLKEHKVEEAVSEKVKVVIELIYKEHDKLTLQNANGDTYTTRSEELMDFLASSKLAPSVNNDTVVEDDLSGVEKHFTEKRYTQSEVDAIRKEAFEAARERGGNPSNMGYIGYYPKYGNYDDYLSSLNPSNNEPLSDSIPTLERQYGKCDCKAGEPYNSLCCPFHGNLDKLPPFTPKSTPQESKQDSKGWEIVSFISKDGWPAVKDSPLWKIHGGECKGIISYETCLEIFPIYSVRRLSDGEVFSVKEITKTKLCHDTEIESFKIENGNMVVYGKWVHGMNGYCDFADLIKLPLTEQPKQVEKPMFLQALERLINGYSMENGSDTPDYILAQYLFNCLQAYNDAVTSRDTSKI